MFRRAPCESDFARILQRTLAAQATALLVEVLFPWVALLYASRFSRMSSTPAAGTDARGRRPQSEDRRRKSVMAGGLHRSCPSFLGRDVQETAWGVVSECGCAALRYLQTSGNDREKHRWEY
jgi:hypothetical protein